MSEDAIMMTVDELAALLRLNRDTAYKAISEQQIPGVRRIGRSIRIHRALVMEWLGGAEDLAAVKSRTK